MLASTLTMAQLSPGAEGIRQKVAEYARSKGMKTNYEGDALTIHRDTLDYAVILSGASPVYVEIRLFDLDISYSKRNQGIYRAQRQNPPFHRGNIRQRRPKRSKHPRQTPLKPRRCMEDLPSKIRRICLQSRLCQSPHTI